MYTLRRHRAFFQCLLLGILSFQSVGWTLIWQWQRAQAAYRAEEVLKEASAPLETCTLATAFFEKIKVKSHEIRWQGRLYDLKKVVLRGDSVQLDMYHDRDEEGLFHALEKIFAHNDSGSGALHIWLVQWLSAAFLPPHSECWHLFHPHQAAAPRFAWAALLPQHEPGCLSPPPDGATCSFYGKIG